MRVSETIPWWWGQIPVLTLLWSKAQVNKYHINIHSVLENKEEDSSRKLLGP